MFASPSMLLSTAALLARLSAAQSTVAFDFLTYNVAGLPALLNGNDVPGDTADVANIIGSKLAAGDYDVVHMQEVHHLLRPALSCRLCMLMLRQDFNYHAYIYETDDHPYRTATTGGVPFGSGLNTVANYNWNTFKQVK